MIKIGLVSDIHSEFWFPHHEHGLGGMIRKRLADADIILLPGDIGVGGEAVTIARTLFPERPVLMLAGNHEFYHGDYAEVRETLRAASDDRVRVLDRDVVELTIRDHRLRVLGTTLWTDFALDGDPVLGMLNGGKALNDFRLIRKDGRLLRPEDTMQWHEAELDWLLATLATPFDGTTVVMTHHAPVGFAVAPRFVGDRLSPCFASRLEEKLIRPDVALVVWGHTHHCVDQMIDTTRFVSNQTGYPSGLATETREFGQIVLV